MIFIAGIAISVFLSALLLVKKNKSTADNILLAWFIVIAVHQFYYYFDSLNSFKLYPFLIGYEMPLPLLHGPFLFLYASALVGNLTRIRLKNLIHFTPALLTFLYVIPFMMLPAERKIYVMENQGVGYETFIVIKSIAIIISGVAYVTATLVLLRRHQKKIMDQFSDIEKINLKWLQYLTYGVAIIWIPVIIGNDLWIFSCVVIFVAVIGFFGIRQTPIFTSQNNSDKNFPPENPDNPIQPDRFSANEISLNREKENFSKDENTSGSKNLIEDNRTLASILTKAEITVSKERQRKYETSGLTPGKKIELAEGLKKYIDDEKLFLNPELSLDTLADSLRIHPNYLSQFINEELNLTFYDFINSKRVEEFKKQVNLPEKSHFSMLGLALECGFNSKSSFNRNFKKFSGQTPSEYLSVASK